jgi:hypothetical protein
MEASVVLRDIARYVFHAIKNVQKNSKNISKRVENRLGLNMTAKEIIKNAKEIVVESLLFQFSSIDRDDDVKQALCNKCGRLDDYALAFSSGFNHTENCESLKKLEIINGLDIICGRI